jgi:uncharacterized protein YeaO (DUF488 family)
LTVRIVRLGTPRKSGEGVRIGTVRRPPRGVPKERFAVEEWYDVWLPNLAPSAGLIKSAQAATSERDWKDFARKYRAEMDEPENARVIDVLAALSQTADFSVGCYCEDEAQCHRSVLRELLREHGAKLG